MEKEELIINNDINIEILNEQEMQLPIVYNGDFIESVTKILDNYINLLNKYSIRESIICQIESNILCIKEIYRLYYLGHHNEAYSIFKKIMKNMLMNNHILYEKEQEVLFFRARINQSNKKYIDSEMFHIPFDKRGIISTQRYSFPGLPCLYLGLSSYVCWVELNRPQINNFQIASLMVKDLNMNHKIIDLSLFPGLLYKRLEKDINSYYLYDYLYFWPIVAMCSISVKSEKDIFKPEYIFPQFMLQYILEEEKDVIGIKYASIKAGLISKKQYISDPRTYINYVFPSTSNEADEMNMCRDLSNRFLITSNYSGNEIEAFQDIFKRNPMSWSGTSRSDEFLPSESYESIFDSNDFSYSYEKTIFMRIELLLTKTKKYDYNEDGLLTRLEIEGNGIKL